MRDGQWVQWVMGAFITVTIALSSYAIARIDQAVMKDDYRIDQARLEQSINCVATDVKQILQRLPER